MNQFLKYALPKLALPIVTLLSPLAAVKGRTVVMDFDSYGASGAANTITSPVNEDGLRLTNPNNFYIFGPGSNRNTGHKALAIQYTNTTTTLAAQNGAPFTLVSMRLSPYSANAPASVTFTGNKAGGGTVTTTLNTGNSLAGVVANFPATFADVTSVTWNMSSASTYHQFDDVTVILQPEITLTHPTLTVTESSGSATVGLALSEPLATAVAMQWTTTAGTATATQDYGATGTSGSFTIPAGQTYVTRTIDIVNDTAVESLEQFTLNFSTTTPNILFTGNITSSTIKIGSEDGVTSFPAWVAAHGLTANAALPEADPNGDTVSNIESWLYRINPAGPSPAAWMERRAVFLFDNLGRPALRFTVPAPLAPDVGITFEETTDLATWSLQATRTGFGVGSLWQGPGSTRVAEVISTSGRTITCSGSASSRNRPKAFLRMRYDYVTGGGST